MYRLDFVLRVDGRPVFGREEGLTLEGCHKRIEGVWRAYNFTLDTPPDLWAYTIKDVHGRTLGDDSLAGGVWQVWETP
jgi:hypothetical protein